jgi:hypothetical protein
MGSRDEIRLESVVVQITELVVAELDGETVMMSVENGKYYGLDEIGSYIWPLIKEPRSVKDVCELLLEEFDVDRQQCERDVLAFFNHLAEEKVIRVVDHADR